MKNFRKKCNQEYFFEILQCQFKRERMKKFIFIVILGSVIMFTAFLGCASIPLKPFEGEVLKVKGEEVILNGGSADYLKIGDQLLIHKVKRHEGNNSKMMGDELELVGIAEVTSIEGKHASKAKIVEGKERIKEGDMVSKYTEESSTIPEKGKEDTYSSKPSHQHSH